MRFDWGTFGLQTVNFAVPVWLLRRFLHKPVLRMIDAPTPFIGDGAYDRSRVRGRSRQESRGQIRLPPCKGAMSGPTAMTAPTERDLHIRSINEHGCMHWQKTSG
jgi:hypothetical protein